MFFQKTQHGSSFNTTTAPPIHHRHPRGLKRESRLPVCHFDQREKSNPPPFEEISRSARNDNTVALGTAEPQHQIGHTGEHRLGGASCAAK